MPNKTAHVITAIIFGLMAGLIFFNNIFYIIIFALLSGITARLPDQIEKPTHKLHRGFFHSKVLLLILIIALAISIWNPLSGLIFGYVTHLLLDYARTNHKPLI